MERSLEDSFQLLHMDDVMTGLNTDSAGSEERLVPPRKRRRWRAVILGLVILVSGMLIGSGGTVFVMHKLLINAIHHPEKAPDRIAKKLKRRLRLSTEQTAEVREILKKRQKALVAIFRKAQPKLERQLIGVREDVAAVLTPEQAKKWRWFFDSMKRKWVPSLRTKDASEGS